MRESKSNTILNSVSFVMVDILYVYVDIFLFECILYFLALLHCRDRTSVPPLGGHLYFE